jgi:uncharacterized Zn-binding protein involved in type VI secretion
MRWNGNDHQQFVWEMSGRVVVDGRAVAQKGKAIVNLS